ncbi:MAG: amidohydrolase family protein, partial [Candidatus Omnitrophota bacterium]|nr:amidohydrolase family protein [Candidatus Omnitrophota bacterium]
KIIASIGHSDATYERAVGGIDAGIAHCTHIFNAMSPLDRRDPGVVGAVLMDDRVVAEVILDLVHVHEALFGLLLKLKKKDSVIIVTDSIAALDCFALHHSSLCSSGAGLAMTKGSRVPEPFASLRFGAGKGQGSRGIAMTGGAYRFEDGRLAGSSLTMIGALKNAVKSAKLPLLEALKMITLNPAKLLKVDGQKGSIAAGKDADITIFDEKFDVKMTMVRGKIVYSQ